MARSDRSISSRALTVFSPSTRDWFSSAFAAPTAAQARGWPAITRGEHTLICAPTGSGKTLAAFLWCLDRTLAAEPADAGSRLRVLYVSPLKALVHDVDRNLRAPLAGIAIAAERAGAPTRAIRVGMRTGDTPASERRTFRASPPDILVTTPESLYLILTSAASAALRGVRWVIIDEIHALAGTKRGAHLALSLERLAAMTDTEPQRIGLSATQRPLTTVAAYLGGRMDARPGEASGRPRPVTIVDAGSRKEMDLSVVVPVEDMGRLGEVIPLEESPVGADGRNAERTSIWPSIYPRILELVRAHRSTIVFTNSRRLAERIALNLNELAGEDIARAHHGSLAREQRLIIEDRLKRGTLPAIVATSSLELGIDMGAVDLVIQVESPLSVARGLQRVGRAGHVVGEPSRGVIFPKYRGDLLEAAVVVRLMHEAAIEPTTVPRNPLDVLAQQLVAATLERPWPVEELYGLVRRAENFAELSRDAFEATLGMLAGQYPADEFAELKPRIIWDRVAGTVVARRDARTVAVTSSGTIPDRGLFPVFVAEADGPPVARAGGRHGGRRVGELDEEMIYESREGDVILLGASAWRIESIEHDRVLVTPAPGQPGKVPFWKGDSVGRPVELGRALGAFIRETSELAARPRRGHELAMARLQEQHGLDRTAAANVLAYLDEEQSVTGSLPTDTTLVLQRFRDELGDWRVCLLTPFGARVHAPWALAIEARLQASLGMDVKPLWSDDGIVLRLPSTEASGDRIEEGSGPLGAASTASAVEAALLMPADELEEAVTQAVGSSALFASRFRENAARALLLPRRRPGQRTPLWQMRQRASQLLTVAARYGSFPIILETYREVLSDVFDLPALRDILAAIERRELRVVSVETTRASPFASSLLFDYIATYMYDGDAPLLDRRAQALTLDRGLLRELLGAEQLRELLDGDAMVELELELQGLLPDRAAGSVDQVHDLLRRVGDLREDEVSARLRGQDARARDAAAREWLEALRADRRAIPVRIAGQERWVAAEDFGRYRDAAGVVPPPGVADTPPMPAGDALASLLARWARTHGPFHAHEPAARWRLPQAMVEAELERAMAAGSLLRGEFRPGGVEREWCDQEVLRRIRRRSLARLRHEIEPVEPEALARFLPAWQGVGIRNRASDRLAEVIAQLEGLPLPASVLERDVLPSRVTDYTPAMLDELGSAGEVTWVGAGTLGRDDGRVRLFRPDRLGRWLAEDGLADGPDLTDLPSEHAWLHRQLSMTLSRGGASFFRELAASIMLAADAAAQSRPAERHILDALWDLVWAGLVTNDTFAPLRALRWPRPGRSHGVARARIGRVSRQGPPEAAGRWSLVSDQLRTALTLGGQVSATERRIAQATAMLERYGVVTRDLVAAEGSVGGFGAVYPIYREMEERGRVRRGYFIEGLGGAQFALAGAVDRLRSVRGRAGDGGDPPAQTLLLAATDPASPYGTALAWPKPAGGDGGGRNPGRVAGAYVVLHDGQLALYLERGGRSLLTFGPCSDEAVAAAAFQALQQLVGTGRMRRVQVERIDGEPVAVSPWAACLSGLGFRPGYRGYVLAAPSHTS